ncbi:MAG TPA: DUF5991 domain-containing protein [Pyrinomonadaceae bacterium]|nr:DUF5991 domain-containing protein [Pyrinomonadaceae bacterium]
MRKFLLTAIGLLVLSLHANAQSDWKGSYSFDENGGKNAGGAVIFISHELSVFDGDEGLAARVQSNGYQTSADLVCSAKVQGEKLLVYFQSYGEDNMFEPYKPGDLLLTLERKNEKGKSIVLTHWGKFTPAMPGNQKSGKVYFARSVEPK